MTTTLHTLLRNTLAARWADLSDEAREWAIERGLARHASVTAELVDCQTWQEDWRHGGGSWPCYDLAVSVDGREIGKVTGWNYVGYVGPDGNYNSRTWECMDNDGAFSGRVRFDDEDGPTIDGGDNVDGGFDLPRQAEDGTVLVYDADEVQDALDDAASEADHGSEPTLDDLDPDDRSVCDTDTHATYYVIRDYRVVAEDVRLVQAYRDDEEDDGRRWDSYRVRYTYLLTGYAAEGSGTVHEDADDAAAEIAGDDGERYDSEEEAQAALDALVDDRLDALALEWERDEDDPTDVLVGEGDATLRLYGSDLAEVCLHGYAALSRLALEAAARNGDAAAKLALADLREEAGR